MSMKKIYPIGDPEADTGRLAAWWEQELEGANIREKVTVQHSPYDDTSKKEGIFESLFNALGGIGQLEITNVFHTALPGTPWPLNAWVYTTQKGIITNLIYQTELPKRIEREITFISKGGGIRRHHRSLPEIRGRGR